MKMQFSRGARLALWPALVTALIVGPAPFFGGCAFIKKPDPEPTPTPVPEMFKDPNAFQAVAIVPGTAVLNDPTGKDATKPMFFRLTAVEAGDLLTLQGIRLIGKTELPQGNPIKVKLAGVFSPAPGQPGWKEAADATSSWLSGRKLDVEQDSKFQITLDNRKVVQITFAGTKKLAGQTVSFNQLLVRSGYAWVDLTSISSFNYKLWVADEEYARAIRVGLSKEDKDRAAKAFTAQFKGRPVPTMTPTPLPKPVGLWAKNIRPPFRKSAPGMPNTPAGGEEVAVPTPPPSGTASAGGGAGPSGSTASSSPTGSPTGSPSGSPTGSPSGSPTGSPSGSPTGSPSGSATGAPPIQ